MPITSDAVPLVREHIYDKGKIKKVCKTKGVLSFGWALKKK